MFKNSVTASQNKQRLSFRTIHWVTLLKKIFAAYCENTVRINSVSKQNINVDRRYNLPLTSYTHSCRKNLFIPNENVDYTRKLPLCIKRLIDNSPLCCYHNCLRTFPPQNIGQNHFIFTGEKVASEQLVLLFSIHRLIIMNVIGGTYSYLPFTYKDGKAVK